MEYIYAAMLLHKAKQKISEPALKKVLEAAGVKVDEARIKATVAALDGVNIDEAISKAAVAPVAAAAPAAHAAGKAPEAGKSKEEEKKKEESSSADLDSLFS